MKDSWFTETVPLSRENVMGIVLNFPKQAGTQAVRVSKHRLPLPEVYHRNMGEDGPVSLDRFKASQAETKSYADSEEAYDRIWVRDTVEE